MFIFVLRMCVFCVGAGEQFAVLYDTWQQGDGFSGSGSGGKSRADNPNNETEGQTAQQIALLEREVEEEDQGESLMFSYAVLTTSTAPRLAWLHERYI